MFLKDSVADCSFEPHKRSIGTHLVQLLLRAPPLHLQRWLGSVITGEEARVPPKRFRYASAARPCQALPLKKGVDARQP